MFKRNKIVSANLKNKLILYKFNWEIEYICSENRQLMQRVMTKVAGYLSNLRDYFLYNVSQEASDIF